MAEENKNPEESTDVDYIAAIKELKETTVPKEQYAKLKEENKRLLQSVLNGEQIEGAVAASTPDIAQLRNELFSGEADFSNLDYISKTLQLREQIIASGGRDPFLPFGKKYVYNPDDEEAAERVAKVLQECVDYADGDSTIFTNELQRVMVDSAPYRK